MTPPRSPRSLKADLRQPRPAELSLSRGTTRKGMTEFFGRERGCCFHPSKPSGRKCIVHTVWIQLVKFQIVEISIHSQSTSSIHSSIAQNTPGSCNSGLLPTCSGLGPIIRPCNPRKAGGWESSYRVATFHKTMDIVEHAATLISRVRKSRPAYEMSHQSHAIS